MFKKAIAIFFVLSLFPQFAFASFDDVSTSHPNYQAIEFLQTMEVVKGGDDGLFHPYRSVTRAEFLKMAFLAFGRSSDLTVWIGTDYVPEFNFIDVNESDWYYSYIRTAEYLEIVSGVTPSEFMPQNPVTAAEALKILYNLNYFSTPERYENLSITMSFAGFHPNDWYAPYAQLAQNQNVFQLTSENLNRSLNRGEVAELIYRLVLINKTGAESYSAELASQVDFFVMPVTSYQKQNLEKLREVLSYLETGYVYFDELQEEEVWEGVNYGLVDFLSDYHTEYLDANLTQQQSDYLEGRFIGYGFSVNAKSEYEFEITLVVSGSPAEEAGLEAGDIISKINDEDINPDNYFILLMELFSEKEVGDQIKLEIQEQGHGGSKEKTLSAREIFIPSVLGTVDKDGIAYIQINQFQTYSNIEFEGVWESLNAETEVKGLIIDLRNNPGGYINSTVDIADYFLPAGRLITTTHSSDFYEKFSAKTPVTINIPVICLIDFTSISAAEMLAAALKENDAATLIGSSTYGKGSVQRMVGISGGGSLKYTYAHWLTPLDQNIDGIGVEPDIEVLYDDIHSDDDPVLERAFEELENILES